MKTKSKIPHSKHKKAQYQQGCNITALCAATALLFTVLPLAKAETVGGGTIDSPAVAPAPAYNIGGGGFVPVKNWNFGTNGTIRNYTDMNVNFYYHDQYGQTA